MKKIELVYREIIDQAIENKNKILTQSELSKKLNVSLSTVNHALKPLIKMNSIEIKQRCFNVTDVKKILYYWASIRNIEKDIIYSTRVDLTAREIEKNMPQDIIYGAYSAYCFRFKDAPSDYSEIYVYGDESLEKRFKKSDKPPNLFVIKKDEFMKGKITSIAQTFVDLWNIKSWYAKEFLKALEVKIDGLLE